MITELRTLFYDIVEQNKKTTIKHIEEYIPPKEGLLQVIGTVFMNSF